MVPLVCFGSFPCKFIIVKAENAILLAHKLNNTKFILFLIFLLSGNVYINIIINVNKSSDIKK